MIDINKVIRGLQCCINDERTVPDCEHCPYSEIGGTCTNLHRLHGDALTLVREAEPTGIRPAIRATIADYWGEGGYHWQTCSNCREMWSGSWNFCPNCGAKIEGSD